MSVTFTPVNANAPESYTIEDGQIRTFPGRVDLGEEVYFNLCNDNAMAMLRALGLPAEYTGECGIPEARRAIMRARATGSAANHTRADEAIYGEPRANEDGTVELRPLRIFSQGLDEDGLVRRINLFAEIIELAATKGATHIQWA